MADTENTASPAAQAASINPTMEQLAMAYRHLWRRGWPPTLEAALAKQSYRVAITQVARNLRRPATVARHLHRLPRPPAPPTPASCKTNKHGRSEYSLATGPQTDIGSWHRPSPKLMMSLPFDAKRAAANDKDD